MAGLPDKQLKMCAKTNFLNGCWHYLTSPAELGYCQMKLSTVPIDRWLIKSEQPVKQRTSWNSEGFDDYNSLVSVLDQGCQYHNLLPLARNISTDHTQRVRFNEISCLSQEKLKFFFTIVNLLLSWNQMVQRHSKPQLTATSARYSPPGDHGWQWRRWQECSHPTGTLGWCPVLLTPLSSCMTSLWRITNPPRQTPTGRRWSWTERR